MATKSGSSRPLILPGSFTMATLPAAAPDSTFMAWTTDGNSGSPGWMYSNGTSWISTVGPAGSIAVGAPVARTLSFATAYQASTPAKAALVSIVVDLTLSLNVGSTSNICELWMGPTTAVTSGTGVLADTYRSDLSVTLITLTFEGRQKVQAVLPANYYFSLNRTVGTGITIVSAFDQSLG